MSEAAVSEAEIKGHVQRVQVRENMWILNYTAKAPVSDSIASMCRGLVVSNESVVAAPFFRFHRNTELDRDQPVEATIKFDGSLIVAFTWQDEMITCSRRRADSEQAVWAQQWLALNAKSTLKQGCTYILEAVYRVNTVVVSYAQDACILLVSSIHSTT